MFNAPSKIGKEKATEQLEKADEMKGDFSELERSVFIHANCLRAQTYSCVKQTQVSLVGYIYSLVSIFSHLVSFFNFCWPFKLVIYTKT